MSLWNQDNIRDVAEAVGIPSPPKDVIENLARDVEFRLGQVLEEALKFMRHSRRTTLTTQDISQALRVLDVEPLYGYESTRPLRFSEASIGPGQPLFYVEDEEVDFEKLINAPLPKVPREISFTAHWLAVDGVQPSIPQNPNTSSATNDLIPKGPGASANLSALNGYDNITVKPAVKHVISKELQLYFDRICSAVLDEANDEYRNAAFQSLACDPGLHQMVAYFVTFVQEKVTHNSKNLFVLEQMMQMLHHLFLNPTLYMDPFVSAAVPPVLTCLLGKHVGSKEANASRPPQHYKLRDFVASLLEFICRRYAKASANLKPRVTRTLLRHFLDPNKPLGTHYGAILGMRQVLGPEGVILAIIPNIKQYDATVLSDAVKDESKWSDLEQVMVAILDGLVEVKDSQAQLVNGSSDSEEELQQNLEDMIGPTIAQQAMRVNGLARAVLQTKIVGI